MTRAIRRVLVAPTAFKGTLGPAAVAAAMAAGVRRALPAADVLERPLSDGGDGLLEACQRLAGGRLIGLDVTGPLGEPVRATLLDQGIDVVVESAQACGLRQLPLERRDPLSTTTRGVGELVLAAARREPQRVVVGLGGSATVDGGTGMARALGWRFLDAAARPLAEGGGSLERLARIVPPAERAAARVLALCDVQNPLTGARGAARVFAPQKGAGARTVERLEAGLLRLAEVIEADLGRRVAELAGAGAAGGLGAGIVAFLGGELVSGAAWMMECAGLAKELERADLVVTGEGSYDVQSGMGKVTGAVVEAAMAAGVLVLLVCGRIDGGMPAGVAGVDGGGRVLGEAELADLAKAGCRGLAGGDRLRGSRQQGKRSG